jgi:hypothetical protein
MRKWYRHLVGFGRKASSQLFEGFFKMRSPGWVEEGKRGRRKVRTVQKTLSEKLLPQRVVLLD